MLLIVGNRFLCEMTIWIMRGWTDAAPAALLHWTNEQWLIIVIVGAPRHDDLKILAPRGRIYAKRLRRVARSTMIVESMDSAHAPEGGPTRLGLVSEEPPVGDGGHPSPPMIDEVVDHPLLIFPSNRSAGLMVDCDVIWI